jgi:2-dehydro-3-deoxyphosphogluconate aldolase / (4S)-4-hydroxy-2-oxoglutarate aldolase
MNTDKILPVYSNVSLAESIKVVQAAYNAGIRRFEYTNRHDNSLEIFKALRKLCDESMTDLSLGAGTIMNVEEAKIFLDSGADFLVSPLISQPLIDFTTENKILWLPGCGTGAEIGMAYNAGITLVKLFPISTLGGPAFIKLMKGPFAKMRFQTSGGVKGEAQEVKALIDAGAEIVGLGNAFFDASLTQEGMTQKLTTLIQNI